MIYQWYPGMVPWYGTIPTNHTRVITLVFMMILTDVFVVW